MSNSYVPVDCDFHDVLEALATRGDIVTLTWRADDAVVRETRARIVDVYARSGADYLRTADGLTVRLDRVVAVDTDSDAGDQRSP